MKGRHERTASYKTSKGPVLIALATSRTSPGAPERTAAARVRAPAHEGAEAVNNRFRSGMGESGPAEGVHLTS